MVVYKDQENPNFSAFGTCGSLSNDPVFDPGRLGKRSDGTKMNSNSHFRFVLLNAASETTP